LISTAVLAFAVLAAKQALADPAARSPGDLRAAEHSLAREARLEPILRLVLARNPELDEIRARTRSVRESSAAVSRLPDPEVEYRLWAQPIRRPLALGSAQMHMVGIRQAFPAPGTLGARSEALSAEASVLSQTRRAREQALIAQTRRAFADYYLADREHRIHLAHVALAEQALTTARAIYAGAGGSQEDVVRAMVETSRMHNDVATVDAERNTARALLNTLMARPVDAPLGPPAALERKVTTTRAAGLERELAGRPDVLAALERTKVSERELDAARASRAYPSFMVGVEYMFMPPMAEPHNYGVSLSMSLPWLNPGYGEQVRAAEAQVSADRNALSAARLTARYELYEARERLAAARESLAIIERDLLPQAEQSYDLSQAVYRGGRGGSLAMFDALRVLLDVRLERERTLARIATALADLERAAGRATVTAAGGARP
jgi:outer membrane protein TolC